MKNGRGKRLFAGVLCAVMMLVLLPAQEAKALKRGDLCPYCKTGRISAVMSTSSQHALRCTSELCEYHYESKWIWESHAINGKSCGISGTCDICGLYARIPHTGGVDVCIMQGVCTRCGESYGPLGHDFSINVDAKEPTCTEIGYTAHKKCSRCSAWNEAYEEIPALDHAMVHHDALAPTCTEVGWEAYDACSRGDYSTYKEIPSLGHDLKKTDKVEPTCIKDGTEAYWVCQRDGCGKLFSDEKGEHVIDKPVVIKALNHDLVHHEAKAPTCTEVGWEAYDACSRGDYSTYKEIPSLGHDLKKTDKVEPTCIKDGTEAYWVCQRDGCGKLFSDEKGEHVIDKPVVIKALNHDLVHHEAKAPTCTEVGWEAYDACSRGDYSTYKDIPSLGHDLSHHAAQAATCTEIGWDAYDTCSRCDYTTYVEKAKLGHDIVHHDAKAPTCTEVGWDAYDTCSRCDYTTYVEKAKLGHDIVHHDAKAPTCTEVGWDAYDTCSRCDYSTYAEKASLGHDLETVAGAEPECAKPGTEAYWVCRRDGCGKLFSDAEGKNAITEPAVIPAKGHTPAAAVKENEKAARVGEAGSYDEVVYCAACGEELSRKTVETDPLPEPKQEEAEPLVSVFDETGAVKLRFFEGGTFTVRIGNKWITYGIYFLEEGVLTLELENVKMPVQEDGSLNFILGEENYLFLFPEEALTILFSAAKK